MRKYINNLLRQRENLTVYFKSKKAIIWHDLLLPHIESSQYIQYYIIQSLILMRAKKVPREKPSELRMYDRCQSRVSRRGGVITIPLLYLPLSITYFFKVDEAIKSVIDSYYLTKGKKDWIDLEK
jgi:hypothetical protein